MDEKFYYILSVGDKVLPYHPYSEKGMENVMNIPYIIGRTNDEGGYSMSFYHHENFFEGLTREEFVELLYKTAKDRGVHPGPGKVLIIIITK